MELVPLSCEDEARMSLRSAGPKGGGPGGHVPPPPPEEAVSALKNSRKIWYCDYIP